MTILFIAAILSAFGLGVAFSYALHKIDEAEQQLYKEYEDEHS